jgi:hypothetical protein
MSIWIPGVIPQAEAHRVFQVKVLDGRGLINFPRKCGFAHYRGP